MAERSDEFVEDSRKIYISTSYSLRGFIDKLVPSIFLCSYAIFLLIEWSRSPVARSSFQAATTAPKPISLYSLHLKELFVLGNHTGMMVFISLLLVYFIYKISMSKKNVTFFISLVLGGIVAFFAFKVNPLLNPMYVRYTLIGVAALSGLYALYYIIYAKTSFVELNARALTIKSGVFSRTNDPTQLHQIKDCNTHKSFFERILGLERVEIIMKGSKEPMLVKYLTTEDAMRIHEYLNANSFDSSTEYWATRDRIKNSSQAPRSPRGVPRQYFDEGNQDQGDGDEQDTEH